MSVALNGWQQEKRIAHWTTWWLDPSCRCGPRRSYSTPRRKVSFERNFFSVGDRAAGQVFLSNLFALFTSKGLSS